jgi:hypothetical protein
MGYDVKEFATLEQAGEWAQTAFPEAVEKLCHLVEGLEVTFAWVDRPRGGKAARFMGEPSQGFCWAVTFSLDHADVEEVTTQNASVNTSSEDMQVYLSAPFLITPHLVAENDELQRALKRRLELNAMVTWGDVTGEVPLTGGSGTNLPVGEDLLAQMHDLLRDFPLAVLNTGGPRFVSPLGVSGVIFKDSAPAVGFIRPS